MRNERTAIVCSSLIAATVACSSGAAAQNVPRGSPRSYVASDVNERESSTTRPAPELIPDPGGPVPEGMRRVRLPIRPLIAAGTLTWLAGYGLSLPMAFTACDTRVPCGIGAIPVAGPFIVVAAGASSFADRSAGVAYGLIVGSMQLIGSTLLTLALSLPRSYLQPLGHVVIGPVSFRDGAGLSISGSFF